MSGTFDGQSACDTVTATHPRSIRRLLITGATGGLGHNAVDSALHQSPLPGLAVRATGRRRDLGAQLQRQGAQFLPLDLSTAGEADWDRLLEGVDVVWHTAALSSPWGREAEFHAANVTATQRLLAAAARQGVQRLVHVSTPALYFDYRDRHNVPETFQAAHPVNAYARTKALAEAEVQRAVPRWPQLHCAVLRPRAIFGPHDQVLLPRLHRVIRERGGRLPLPRGGLVRLDLTYVGNVVQALWCATLADPARVPSGAVFNITNHEPIVLREVLQTLYGQLLGERLQIVSVPWPLMASVAQAQQWLSCLTGREPALTPYSVGALGFDMTLDNTRARDLLGYRPTTPMAQALQLTAQWWQAQAQGPASHTV